MDSRDVSESAFEYLLAEMLNMSSTAIDDQVSSYYLKLRI